MLLSVLLSNRLCRMKLVQFSPYSILQYAYNVQEIAQSTTDPAVHQLYCLHLQIIYLYHENINMIDSQVMTH